MKFSLIPKEALADLWRQAEPMIQKALDRFPGRYEAVDVYIDLLRGDQTLWGIFDDDDNLQAVWTLRIVEYPQSRSCLLEWVAGSNVDAWFEDALEVIKDYAKRMSCDMVETNARPGWKTRAKKSGWTMRSVSYEINLKG